MAAMMGFAGFGGSKKSWWKVGECWEWMWKTWMRGKINRTDDDHYKLSMFISFRHKVIQVSSSHYHDSVKAKGKNPGGVSNPSVLVRMDRSTCKNIDLRWLIVTNFLDQQRTFSTLLTERKTVRRMQVWSIEGSFLKCRWSQQAHSRSPLIRYFSNCFRLEIFQETRSC